MGAEAYHRRPAGPPLLVALARGPPSARPCSHPRSLDPRGAASHPTGMRPAREPFDPYTTLGLSPGADRAEIGRAYRRRAREIHPDATGTDTTAAMARLNRARDEAIARTAPGPRRTARRESAPASEPDGGYGRRAGDRGQPAMGTDHEPEWADYWSAWNDPPRRRRTSG